MPGPGDPGGTGDVHACTLMGEVFDFVGDPTKFYDLLTHKAIISLHGSVKTVGADPTKTVHDCLVFHLGDRDNCRIMITPKETLIWRDPYWIAVIQDDGGAEHHAEEDDPLKGVPHLDYALRQYPKEGNNRTGLLIFGKDKDPALFVVGDRPAPESIKEEPTATEGEQSTEEPTEEPADSTED